MYSLSRVHSARHWPERSQAACQCQRCAALACSTATALDTRGGDLLILHMCIVPARMMYIVWTDDVAIFPHTGSSGGSGFCAPSDRHSSDSTRHDSSKMVRFDFDSYHEFPRDVRDRTPRATRRGSPLSLEVTPVARCAGRLFRRISGNSVGAHRGRQPLTLCVCGLWPAWPNLWTCPCLWPLRMLDH